jgi:diadenosine tetraphosphate (Ap4A) HIT family hydrolase
MIWTSVDGPVKCGDCGFEIYLPLLQSGVCVLGLYDDSRFPGRCILSLKDHFEHLDEVPAGVLREFNANATAIGRTMREKSLAIRVNYAVLGNEHPHVHMHIIPRRSTDQIPNRPIWEHPEKAGGLATVEKDHLIEVLRSRLLESS